jgi:hypothetical protein
VSANLRSGGGGALGSGRPTQNGFLMGTKLTGNAGFFTGLLMNQTHGSLNEGTQNTELSEISVVNTNNIGFNPGVQLNQHK